MLLWSGVGVVGVGIGVDDWFVMVDCCLLPPGVATFFSQNSYGDWGLKWGLTASVW